MGYWARISATNPRHLDKLGACGAAQITIAWFNLPILARESVSMNRNTPPDI
jgi:hypothetical protein